MRRTLVLSIALLMALAGCANLGGKDDDEEDEEEMEPTPTPIFTTPTGTTPTPATATPTPTPGPALDSSTYAIATSGVPGQSLPGVPFNFTMWVNGSVNVTSEHIGAHYASNDTTNPPGSGRGDCDHVNGALPGMFTVTCTIPTEGSWYVWGHARVNDSGELRNWWTPTPAPVKVRTYALNLSNLPTNPPASKSNFTFTLTINGTQNVSSDHVGAHFWNATTATPTVANAAGSCNPHLAPAGVVDTFAITCSIEHTGIGGKDFFLRGHLRLTEGGTTLNWWSDEVKVSILGVPASPLP